MNPFFTMRAATLLAAALAASGLLTPALIRAQAVQTRPLDRVAAIVNT